MVGIIKSGWWVRTLSLGIFHHHPQKSFRLDQKYFETFIILGMALVPLRCYKIDAWNFANHVQYVFAYKVYIHGEKLGESAKAQKLQDRWEENEMEKRTSEKERESDFYVYHEPFFGNEIISMAKLQQSNYYGRGSFPYGMDVENAIQMPQQDCVQSLPEVSV